MKSLSKAISTISILLCAHAYSHTQDSTTTDSLSQFPRLEEKETWEKVVDAPGYLLSLPFYALNKTIEGTVYVIDEYKIPQKVRGILVSEDGTRVIMPTYNAQVGPGVAITKKELFNKESLLKIGGSYWIDDNRHSAITSFSDLEIAKFYKMNIISHYQYIPDEHFFGIGPRSDKKDELEYLNQEIVNNIEIVRELDSLFYLQGNVGFNYNNIEIGDSSTTTHGLIDDALSVAYIGGEIGFNNLHPSYHPLSGTDLSFASQFYQSINAEETIDFYSNEISWTQYFHVFQERVFLFEITSRHVEGFSQGQVPFYYQSEIGEDYTVRGYPRGRFRDQSSLYGRLEYRYPIWSPAWRLIEFNIFVDGGQVQNSIINDFDVDDMNYGYGFGFQFYSEFNKVLTLEFGFSDEIFRFYAKLN